MPEYWWPLAWLAAREPTRSVIERPTVFATLTAPSFGAVHRQAANGPCHPAPRGRCAHGRELGCWERHGGGDDVVGSPLCSDCYDYEAAIIWNCRVTELWRRTVIATARAAARRSGMTVRAFTAAYRVSFVKVVEYQKRGSIHLHAVLRIDSRNGDEVTLEATRLAEAVRIAAWRVQVRNPLMERHPIRWGPQLEAAVVSGSDRRRVANYLAKYATKSADDDGTLDHRITEADMPDWLCLHTWKPWCRRPGGWVAATTWRTCGCDRGHTAWASGATG
ncbi:MAG TPA: replication initiator [Acidimicrobiales bacterium]|nr:replication initiator [Acidimicrobiales bacterium]